MNRLQISLAALALAAVAALIIPGNELGLGFFFVMSLGTAIVIAARPASLSLHSVGFGALALVLAAMTLVRAADWVVAVNLFAALAMASLAIAGGSTRQEVVLGASAVVTRLGHAVTFLLTPLRGRVGGVFKGRTVPAVRGLVIGAYLLIIFGFLFATADRAFQHLAAQLASPSVGVSEFPVRFFMFLLFFVLVGAFIVIGPKYSTRTEDPFVTRAEPQGLALLEWALPLGLLNALFLGFVGVQLTVLFGGHQHVLGTVGLSYAEYARSGFFQLLAVALLTMVVIGAAVRWARVQGSLQKALLRGLLILLCLSTLVVLGSAMKRLMLYEDAYGLTRLRISVHAVIIVLAIVFVMMIAATILWKGKWLARASVGLIGLSLVAFSLVNPDAQIARQNVARFEQTGSIDATYLSSLSVDAASALDDLPAPLNSCVIQALDGADPNLSWTEINLSRLSAQEVVSEARRTAPVDCIYRLVDS